MATDSQRTVQLPLGGQPDTTPASSSNPTEPYSLETIYNDALLEVETLHASGKLPQAYYDILTTTKTPQDLLSIVDGANERRMGKQSQSKHALYSAVSSTIKRLDRYAGAIDMLAQSSPQAFGLNIVGLIWGSLKVLLVVAQDVIDTFEMVVQTLEDMESSLPMIETFDADIRLVMISLGLGVVGLCEQGSLHSLGRSTWTSLQGHFRTSVAELTRAAQLVHRAAQVEHMNATQKVRKIVDVESRRQEHFRREILRNMRQPVERGPLKTVVPSNGAPLGFLAPQFTGREKELAQLKMVLNRRSDGLPARCSIVGMPGLGKTQLALKYASQMFDPLNGPMILWTSAATTEKLAVGYSEILNLVDHVDRDHTDQGLKLRTARRWLESAGQEQGLPWLLVFDNVNEDTVPFLREYLPQTNENLAMLFTMRSDDVAKTLINPTSSAEAPAMLPLEVPSPDEARDLLIAELEAPNEVDAASQLAKAEKLVKSVGYLPLAIHQVASFASQHSKNLDYILGVYQNQQEMDIMKWDNQLSTYEQQSVMTAFSSSLNDLAKTAPLGSLLLQTLSFFDPESIPLDMIVAGALPICDLRAYSESRKPELSEPPMPRKQSRDSKPKRRLVQKLKYKILGRSSKASKIDTTYAGCAISTVDFNDQMQDDLWAQKMSEVLEDRVKCPETIKQLRLLAFVTHRSDTDGEKIRMHDLARSMVRYNAKQNPFDPICYRMAAAIVDYALHVLDEPWSQSQTWLQYETILPHYRSIVSFQEAQESCNIEIIRASVNIANYLDCRGRCREATQTIKVMLPIQQKCLERINIDYLATLDQLAGTHSLQGDFQEAERLAEQVSKAREVMLGAKHLDTLKSKQRLVSIYARLSRYEEAISLQEMVVSTNKKRFGADHKKTLSSQYDSVKVYLAQGNVVEAELIYEDTLRSMEKTLGTSDYHTLVVVRDLGTLKYKVQLLDEADVLLSRALAALSREHGSYEWPITIVEWELGNLRKDQESFVEAEVHLKACLVGREKSLGTEHVITIQASNGLAWLYIDMGRFADAEPLFRRAVSIDEISDDFKDLTFESYLGLAFAVERQSRLAEAERFYRQALDLHVQDPIQHPMKTVLCTEALSRVLYAQEAKKEAVFLHEYALNKLEEALKTKKEAAILHERAVDKLEGALSRLYRRGIYDTNEDWYILITICRVLESEEMCKIALKVQEEKIGFSHPVTQRTLQALVAILHRNGKTKEEEALVQRRKGAGLELRLPKELEAPGPDGGNSGAESADQDASTVQVDELASGQSTHGLHAREEMAAGSR